MAVGPTGHLFPLSSALRIASERSAIPKSIVTGAPLSQILSDLTCLVEGDGMAVHCGICVFDRTRSQVVLSVGPNLPGEYCSQLLDIPPSELEPCPKYTKIPTSGC